MKLSGTLVLLGLLSSAVGAAESAQASTGRDPTLSGTYLAGRSAGRQRDMEEAADYLTAALKLDPDNTQIIERLFQFRLSEGSLPEAEELAAKVIDFNSQQRMARVVLGLKEFRNNQFKPARGHFSEAAYTPVGELTSSLLSAWANAGDGALNPALKELDKLAANESFASFRLFHEALITDLMNSKVRAETAYKKAYEQAGGSMRVTQAYANYLQRNGKTAAAQKVLMEFLKSGERNPIIENTLAEFKSGKIPEPFAPSAQAGAGEALFSIAAAMNDEESADVALLYAQLALIMNPDKPVMQSILGDIYSGMQRYELSNEVYEQIGATSPIRPGADIQIALNLQRMDKSVEAVARLKAVVEKQPENIDAWTTLGNVYRTKENYADSVPAYTKAIDLAAKSNKPDWQLFYYRGIAQERLKDWPKAEADFQQSLKISPDQSSVLNYYGYSLVDRGEQQKRAMEMVKRAVELRPNDGYIVDSLGWAFYQIGNYEEALLHMERAVDLKAGDPIIAEHLGDVYWRVGRKLEAKFQWQHAKDNKPEPEDLKRIEQKLKDGLPEVVPVTPAENQTPKANNG